MNDHSFFCRLRIALMFAAAAFAFTSQAATKYWRGAVGSSAADAANWSDSEELGAEASSAPPANGDVVVLDGKAAEGDVSAPSQRALVWDLDDVTLGGWIQNGYTNVVTFKTGRNGYDSDNALKHAYGVLSADGTNRTLSVSGDINVETGIWTHFANPAFSGRSGGRPLSLFSCTNGVGVYRMLVNAGGNFTLGADARIDVSGKGYVAKNGPGNLYDLDSANRQGACHGGTGAVGGSGWSFSYGSFREADTLGSGGTSAGGGAVVISASGSVTLNGRIAADAAPSSDYYAGAGGSVSVRASSITSSETSVLSADGGPASKSKGGGGGRIALRLTGPGDFSGCLGILRAAGRKEVSSGNCASGGTVYRELLTDGAGGGELVIDGVYTDDPVYTVYSAYDRRIYTRVSGVDLSYRPKKITLRNGAAFGVAAGDVWDISEASFEAVEPDGYRNRIRLAGGTLVLPERLWSDVDFFATAASVLRVKADGSGVFKLGDAAVFTGDSPVTIEGALELFSGAKITHTKNDSSKVYGIDLAVTRSVTNHAGGVITAQGKGFATKQGPGKPNTFDSEVGGNANRGGSHAGLANKEIGDICYGSPTRPVTMGSGGMSNSGGGTVRMVIAGELVNDGEIQANGPTASYHTGAGGSVWVTAGSISGTGAITANGGDTTNGSWPTGGGGGRVAVWLTDPDADFSRCDVSRITAFGGALNKVIRSAAGTVYLKTGAQSEDGGTLVIANADTTVRPWTEIGSDMETVRVGSLVIRDKGRFRIRPGHRIEVSGDWLNSGTFQADAGSVVELVSTDDAHITGTNTFDTLSCTVGGKKIRFGTEGTKTTIASGGKLVLNGVEGALLDLSGDVAGTQWLFAAGEGADVSDLEYLKVTCCDATETGQNLVANKSEDGGGNSANWSFFNVQPGAPMEWTGAVDRNWANGANWNPARPPVETDVVTIPAGCERYPQLSSPLTLNTLTIASDASLALEGNAVTVTNSLTIAGTCTAAASDVFTVEGDVDLSAGSYAGQLKLAGANVQRVSAGEGTLPAVTVVKTGGSVEWTRGLKADRLYVGVSTALTMNFAAGKTVSLKELRLDGTLDGAVGLTMAASGEGRWLLEVSDYERVSGVAVSGCDASGGLAIHGDAPCSDAGGNVNWVFGESVSLWQGGSSGDFSTPENWSTGKVPGANDRVIIDSGAVTLDEAAEIAQLTVGDGDGAASLTVTAELAVGGGTDVRDGGTLSLNAPSTIGGSLFVRGGGVLTHKANASADTYKLDLAVAGNATVEAGGAIDVTGKGYAAYAGPGCANGNSASSHGGRGANGNQPEKVKPCYGSIMRPFLHGSGSVKDSLYISSAGGGVAKITVAGMLRVDGLIAADGQHAGQSYYSSSGGSVWITAGILAGTGIIRANGSPVTGFCPGAGGRVALYQTIAQDLAGSSVTLQARGGYIDTGSTTDYRPHSAGGTVYIRNAGSATGTVVLEDGNGVEKDKEETLPFATDIPVTVDGDPLRAYREMNFEVSAGGVLSLTADCTINDLMLGENAKVRLNDHALTIISQTHRRGRGWSANRSIDLGENEEGRIVWPCGFTVIVK